MNFAKGTNVGGLVRTANAAALREVIIVGRKKWNKAAATGAQSGIRVVRLHTASEFIDYCRDKKYNIISVEIGKNSENIFDYKYPKNPILVIGNEGTGVPQPIIDSSHSTIYIPQYGSIECLNSATVGSIAIYDWIQKNCNHNESMVSKRKFRLDS